MGGSKSFRADIACGNRGSYPAVGEVVDANKSAATLERVDWVVAVFAIAAVLLWQVFRPGPITVMRVQGAIAAYLCIGAGWAHAYHIVALLDPGAFDAAGSDASAASSWVNYSFGMLTTVGYTGIAAVHPLAHTLGSAEAVTGQLYLAVLVARLVSMQVSGAGKGADESSRR